MADRVLCRIRLDNIEESAVDSYNHCGFVHVENLSGNQPGQR